MIVSKLEPTAPTNQTWPKLPAFDRLMPVPSGRDGFSKSHPESCSDAKFLSPNSHLAPSAKSATRCSSRYGWGRASVDQKPAALAMFGWQEPSVPVLKLASFALNIL